MSTNSNHMHAADWISRTAGFLRTSVRNSTFYRHYVLRGFLLFSAILPLAGCARVPDESQSQDGFWWPERILTQEERQQESAEKLSRLVALLKKEHLSGVLIASSENFSWLTAGSENPVPLFVREDGRVFLFAGPAEGVRLLTEDLKGMGFELEKCSLSNRTLEDALNVRLRPLTGGQTIASDVGFPEAKPWDRALTTLHVPLTSTEIREYRWLGRRCAEVVEAVCRRLKSGMTEQGIAALLARELQRHAIHPVSIRVASDERIRNFGAAPPSQAKKLDKAAMVSICGRRWGLHVSLTRIVHFGPVPEDLKMAAEAAALINANCWARTLPGAPIESIVRGADTNSIEGIFPSQSTGYEQGGAIGYFVPSGIIQKSMHGPVMSGQTFAWSPTVQGIRIEDTILIEGENLEVMTRTPDWPVIESRARGRIYRSAGILVQ